MAESIITKTTQQRDYLANHTQLAEKYNTKEKQVEELLFGQKELKKMLTLRYWKPKSTKYLPKNKSSMQKIA